MKSQRRSNGLHLLRKGGRRWGDAGHIEKTLGKQRSHQRKHRRAGNVRKSKTASLGDKDRPNTLRLGEIRGISVWRHVGAQCEGERFGGAGVRERRIPYAESGVVNTKLRDRAKKAIGSLSALWSPEKKNWARNGRKSWEWATTDDLEGEQKKFRHWTKGAVPGQKKVDLKRASEKIGWKNYQSPRRASSLSSGIVRTRGGKKEQKRF